MDYTTETITPEKAMTYLKTSEGNRPISDVYVKSYADTMRKGKWLLNGMCIIFDENGHLIDGNHRLHAVIEAGIPVRFDVCRGASKDSFVTYDCGRHRTIGQILAMQGVKHYNMVGSIVSANAMIETRGRLQGNTAIGGHVGRGRDTNSAKYDSYSKDPEGYNAAAIVIVRLQSRCRILPASWAGGIYYYLTHKGGWKENVVLAFFEALYTLDTSNIEVVNNLRKRIIDMNMNGRKMSPELLWAYIAKTWNFYVNGRVARLSYDADKETLPFLECAK